MYGLQDFLLPVNIHCLNDDAGYNDGQFAKHILTHDTELPDITNIDIVLVGVGEYRGGGYFDAGHAAADAIRKQLYQLHYWHFDVSIADIGNIKMPVM